MAEQLDERCPMDGGILDREVFAATMDPEPYPYTVHDGIRIGRYTSWIDTCRRCGWERIIGREARQAARERRLAVGRG